MRQFTVKSKKGRGGYTFLTNDRWTGLWAPKALLDSLAETDGHHPGHQQVRGTCDVQGEAAVRKAAREMVADHEYFLEAVAR